MDEFLKELARFGDFTDTFTVLDVALVLVLSFVLNLAVAWNYRYTHRGISYSQSFAQTLVLMGVVVGLVMLIIGSNTTEQHPVFGTKIRQAVLRRRVKLVVADPRKIDITDFRSEEH